MSHPIEVAPARKSGQCVAEPLNPQLEAVAHTDWMSQPGLYNPIPEASKIRMEAWLALQGDASAARAVQGELRNLAQHPGSLTPVLEYLGNAESTQVLPQATVEFEPKSRRIAAITFVDGCLDPNPKYSRIRFEQR